MGKKGERPFLFQVKEIRRGRATRQADGLLICPMYVKSLSIKIYRILGGLLSSVGLLFRQKCIVFYIMYMAHIISRRLLLHMWTNICMNMMMSDVNFLLTTLQTLFYLFWHHMYLFFIFFTLHSFRNFLFVLTLYLFILTSSQVTWLSAIQTQTSYLDFRFRPGIQAPVHMRSAFFKRGFEFPHNLIHYSFCEPRRLLSVQ